MRTITLFRVAVGVVAVLAVAAVVAQSQPGAFGPSNPFYAQSTLPFQAPPFDKIKDSD